MISHPRCIRFLRTVSVQKKHRKISTNHYFSHFVNRTLPLFLGAFLAVLLCTSVRAQVISRVDPTGRSGDERPELLKERLPELPPKLVLPPLPPEKKEGFPLKGVFIRKIIVTGCTAFSPEEVAEITSPYENLKLTNEDLEALRRALTVYYINKGYINSGAIVPDQTVAEGVIQLHVIEGKLTHIDVDGNKWLGDGYIANRLILGTEPPLNILPLQQRLQLLQQDSRIQQIKAELKPGVKPGESLLEVHVKETNPLKGWFAYNNYQSPTVGAERGLITVSDQSLTGHGDILSFTYGRSEGLVPQIDVWYSIPITARDTTVTLNYRKNDFENVEDPFKPLDIESESEVYQADVRHPLYRSLNQEFALRLTGEHLRHQTFMLGTPFSFSPGAEDGKSKVTALRFSQEWTYRSHAEVIAASSRLSVGIDAMGATKHDSGLPDGEFISWLGQFQWARVFNPWGIQMIFRTDIQLTDDNLLPLEQIAVGGRYSVRGYRENQLVRDNGFIASLESRIPLVRNKPWADYLQLVPFVDFGKTWDKGTDTHTMKSITGIGLGLRWAATWMPSTLKLRPRFEFYWGVPTRDIDTPGHDLQDRGLHFQFVLSGF